MTEQTRNRRAGETQRQFHERTQREDAAAKPTPKARGKKQ